MTEQMELADDLAEIARRAELTSVYAQELTAVRTSPEAPARFALEFEPQIALSSDHVDYRLVLGCKLLDPHEAPVAEVRVAIVGRYALAKGRQIPELAYHAYAERGAVPDLYPYARQHLQDLCARIGFSGLTLGPLKSDATIQLNGVAGAPN